METAACRAKRVQCGAVPCNTDMIIVCAVRVCEIDTSNAVAARREERQFVGGPAPTPYTLYSHVDTVDRCYIAHCRLTYCAGHRERLLMTESIANITSDVAENSSRRF